MNIVKWKPAVNHLAGWDFDRVLEDFFNHDFWGTGSNYPRVDVREEDNQYVLEADFPGLTEKDIEVKVEDNLLTLSSAKKEEKEDQKDGYLVRERRAYSFYRSFVLPKDVAKDKIEAAFTNGLLTLTIAKAPEAQPRTIEVKTN